MIDRATFTWGTYLQSKINETKEVPAKNEKKQAMQLVPRFTEVEIEQMLDGNVAEPLPDIDISDPFSIDVEDDKYRPRNKYKAPTVERSV